MKMKRPIDLHKGLTAVCVLALMAYYDNYTIGPWVYLGLHGTYGLMWVFKSRVFPDPSWEVEVPVWKAIGYFLALLLYWVAPFLLISSGVVPPNWVLCLAIVANALGTCLHFGSDAQKFFVLKTRRGLITDGFFSRTRNPNYLGEILIYGSFAAVSMHWIPWVICGLFWGFVFVPNMLKKDRSMSRYEEWESYTNQSGLLLPRL